MANCNICGKPVVVGTVMHPECIREKVVPGAAKNVLKVLEVQLSTLSELSKLTTDEQLQTAAGYLNEACDNVAGYLETIQTLKGAHDA